VRDGLGVLSPAGGWEQIVRRVAWEVIMPKLPTISDGDIENLVTELHFRGAYVRPGDAGYEGARAVWNGSVVRKPVLVARCTGTADVVTALRFAREHGLDIAVRGGGHGLPGFGTCDGGLVIDLSPMTTVRVDPANKRAWADGGATWAEFDRETQLFGLAATGGVVSTTGVGGLTLGGGIGWLTRPFGLACDNLRGAEVVTADGEVVFTSEHENPDLLWALKGGGGNFGIVTNFEFELHPLGPVVMSGLVGYPAERAGDVYRFYREFAADAPDVMGLNCVLMVVPPLPEIPAALHGHDAISIAAIWAGAPDGADAAVEPLRRFGPPAVDLIAPTPYVGLQQMMDPLFPRGRPAYMKSGYLDELGDGAIDALCEQGTPTGAPSNLIECIRLGGAMAQVDASESAFSARDAAYCFNIVAAWDDTAETDHHVDWARRTFDALEPYARDAAYVNFIAETGEAAVKRAYAPEQYRQLQDVKAKYDPDNVFHLNQNIVPGQR
jgi:FAD/FMN-containing dehydrogenase